MLDLNYDSCYIQRGLWGLLFWLCVGVAPATAGLIDSQVLEEQTGWQARIEINCFLPSQVCGRFEYKALACQGELEYIGVRDKGFEFREKLFEGKCAPGCLLVIADDLSHYRETCFGKLSGEGRLSVSTGSTPAPETPSSPPKVVSLNQHLKVETSVSGVQAGSTTSLPVWRDCKGLLTAGMDGAKKIQASTTTYLGDFLVDPKSGLVSGLGRVQWANGDLFVGTLVEGNKQGKGCFVWSNGQQYDGDWVADRQSGRAAILFANGNRYDGGVLDGVPDGQGVFLSIKGDQYSGSWQKGKKHGSGKFLWSNGQSYVGDWLADEPTGNGEIVYANGDRFSGGVLSGAPHGKGVKLFSASGDRYEGYFLQGESHGEGTYSWKSGDKYVGHWSEGKKTGHGRYTWVNGDYWEGIFEADKQADGVLHVASVAPVTQDGVEALLQQTRSASESASTKPSATPKGADRDKLKLIPMVAAELLKCAKVGNGVNCQQEMLDAIEHGGYFKHDWQTMFSEKTPAGGLVTYEVDRSSVSVRGIVFSWFRFLDSISGVSRNTGVKYDCRSRALDIQLLFSCEGGAQASKCTLDGSFDKYVGKAIPAATIKGWFKSACERSAE